MNYVSCSPFRVPIARLAAAHAAIEEIELKAQKPSLKVSVAKKNKTQKKGKKVVVG
jgi:pyruvate,orthophosphate dikinase